MINTIDPYLPSGAALNPEAPYHQSDDEVVDEQTHSMTAEQFRATLIATTIEAQRKMLAAALKSIDELYATAPRVKVIDLTSAADELALAAIRMGNTHA